MALGKRAAPHVKAQANKLVPENIKKSVITKDKGGRSKMDDIAEVAGAGLKGKQTGLGSNVALNHIGRVVQAES